MSKTTTQNTIAALEAEHQKLHAEHEAKLAELSAKKEAITALRAPVATMLAERADLLAKLHHATANKELLQAGVTRWQNYQDEVWAGDEGARTFVHRAQMPQSDFLCAAALIECEKYLLRTRAQLDSLNSKLASYCAKHGLEDMLPAN
jgi:hypothetical protein